MSDRSDGLEDLADIIQGLFDDTTDPDRPFTGQSHTSKGERGKTEVKSIRFRDLKAMGIWPNIPQDDAP